MVDFFLQPASLALLCSSPGVERQEQTLHMAGDRVLVAAGVSQGWGLAGHPAASTRCCKCPQTQIQTPIWSHRHLLNLWDTRKQQELSPDSQVGRSLTLSCVVGSSVPGCNECGQPETSLYGGFIRCCPRVAVGCCLPQRRAVLAQLNSVLPV